MAEDSAPPDLASTPSRRHLYLRLCQTAWTASPLLAVLLLLATTVSTLTPFGVVVVSGLVVQDLTDVLTGTTTSTSLLTLVAILGALAGLQWISTTARTLTGDALGDRVDLLLQSELMDGVMRPTSIAHLETPGTVDLIAVGRDTFSQWLKPGRTVGDLTQLWSAYAVLFGACGVISWALLPAGPLLLAASLWAVSEGRKVAEDAAEMHYGASPESRRSGYFYELGTEPEAAKEVRVFGLADFIDRGYIDNWRRANEHAFARGTLRERVAVAVLFLAAALILAWVCWSALRSSIETSQALIVAQAIVLAIGAGTTLGAARLRAAMAMRTLQRHDAALAAIPTESETGAALPANLPTVEIRFDKVCFRYPGASEDVLHNFDLVIPAGQSVALVGVNGVGKTTLIKLLCRFYEPTGGQILIDGVDLGSYDPVHWQRTVAAVFQENVRWELSAATNIGFGHPESLQDVRGIREAADRSGVADAINRLDQGWDTTLSSQFVDGSDLSGGEWQKLALARALFAVDHGSTVLILDEPAAHLDARSEAALHAQFLDLTAGRTSIVVSHRFSTVRQASTIVVIDQGQIVESGTHDELVELDGRYASMFRLQAASFTEPRHAGLDGNAAVEGALS